jgi:NhaP-type Na+/H+ or K+/H+ antiporter
VDDAQIQPAFPEKTDGVGSWTTRELLISSVAGVRGAITLAGVLSIPLLLPDGNVFPARYELVFLAAGVILFSLFVGVIVLPILLRHIESSDHVQQRKEERLARAATADVAIVAIQKMEERLAADTKENIDNQLLTEVSSRVIGNLRRRADGVTMWKPRCWKRASNAVPPGGAALRARRAVPSARHPADQQRDAAEAAARPRPAGSAVIEDQ